jgi:hypothetical protein
MPLQGQDSRAADTKYGRRRDEPLGVARPGATSSVTIASVAKLEPARRRCHAGLAPAASANIGHSEPMPTSPQLLNPEQ